MRSDSDLLEAIEQELNALGDCHESPLFIFPHELKSVAVTNWSSGEHWVETLGAASPLGIVLPLELRVVQPNPQWRQNLWGMDLLFWLRWSARDEIRFLPVLALAWEALHMLLRRRADLLLTTRGTWVAQLPVHKEITHFIRQVREGTAERCNRQALSVSSRGAIGEAANRTRHELANDHYAAYRLWTGYLSALKAISPVSKAVQKEITRASGESLECTRRVLPKIRQPWYRQLQESTLEAPAYPSVAGGNNVVRRHVESGLGDVRILFVDDEYDKGMGEALLRILFGAHQFTVVSGGQSVYSVSNPLHSAKARFVCVKNVGQALCWLIKWGKLPYDVLRSSDEEKEEEIRPTIEEFRRWYEDWAAHLGYAAGEYNKPDFSSYIDEDFRGVKLPEPLRRCKAIFTRKEGHNDILCLDDDLTPPRYMKTIILLDLRLEHSLPERTYSPRKLASVRFRELVMAHQGDDPIPVIIFTASRQAINYAEVMSSAGRIDGWLCKEAPDVPANDENSKNAVHYLLSHLYTISAVDAGYRDEMEWASEQKQEYEEFWNAKGRVARLQQIAVKASDFLREIRSGKFAQGMEYGVRAMKQVRSQLVLSGFGPYEKLGQILVARRVGVATLIETAKIDKGGLEWDVPEFARLLHKQPEKRAFKRPNEIINFNDELRLHSYTPKLLRQLFPEEYQWLLEQEFSAEKKRIIAEIRSAVLPKAPEGDEPAITGEETPTAAVKQGRAQKAAKKAMKT